MLGVLVLLFKFLTVWTQKPYSQCGGCNLIDQLLKRLLNKSFNL